MPTSSSATVPDLDTTRRRFLSGAAAAGAALAGGLTASSVSSAGEADPAAHAGQCDFSALPADFVYLNNGTEGSMPACVLSAHRDALSRWASDPTGSYETDPVLGKRQESNRSAVAQFLGVGKNNVCLTDNTTMGCSMTLMGLSFRPEDRVVTTNHEHNAIRSPLQVLRQRQGLRIETRVFPPAETLHRMGSAELLETLLPNSPALRGAKALCVSHVYPTTGLRLPLRALREKADQLDIRYLIVDGAQAMGMVDLGESGDSLENCDFYACPGHKWLNGPPSTGVLYIRNADIRPPEFYPVISQRMGRYSDCDEGSATCFPMAEALQVRGCSNAPGFAAFVRAVEFTEESGGADRVEKHILGLAREVRNIILARAPHCLVSPHSAPELTSGMTTFLPFDWDRPQRSFRDKKTAERVVAGLLERNIQVRSIGFEDADSSGGPPRESHVIRVSTGQFNTADQIEIFQSALREVLIRID